MVSSSSQAGTIPGDKVGGKKRERKAEGGKMLGTLNISLFVSVIYTSKIVLQGKVWPIHSFHPEVHAHKPNTQLQPVGFLSVSVHQLKTRGKPKLHCFLITGVLKLASHICRCYDGPFQSYPCIYTHRFASRISHRCNIGPGPAWHPTLMLITTTTSIHTHKPSAPLLDGPADPHLIPIHGGGGGVLTWAHPREVRERKYMPSLILAVSLSLSHGNILLLCVTINLNMPTITPKHV